MPRTHPAYPPEFRHQMVELVRSGRSIRELARDFECSEQTIRNWLRQADLDKGRRDDGLTSVERDELGVIARFVPRITLRPHNPATRPQRAALAIL